MKAFCHRFKTPSGRAEELERETDKTRKQLGKRQRKTLLRLVNLEVALRDQSCWDSFMSGYRVAHGIHQELLDDQLPYNFEDEDERLNCERLMEG